MKKDNITILSSEEGDWEGLYFNNKLMIDGHSIDCGRLLTVLKSEGVIINFGNLEIEFKEITEEELDELGYSFPRDLEDINK